MNAATNKAPTSKRRTHSPITGEPYPKCSVSGCADNVYADGRCYVHQCCADTCLVGHRFGGVVTPTHVGHKTHNRVAYWYVRGNVKWDDGTESIGTEITPDKLCIADGADELRGHQELNAVLAAMNKYLTDAGAWLREPKRVRGMLVHWLPHEKNGEVPL